MKNIKSFVFLFIFLYIFWLLLNPWNWQALLAGAVIVALISGIFRKYGEILAQFKLNPKSILYSLIYIFVFLKELIKSNLDVAQRVLSPKLPITPGIVKVKTNLNSDFAKTILANSITLTPGTLSVDLKGKFLYIHWINVTTEGIEATSRAIVGKFEKYLEVMFD
ncbi:MAG: Na+/H+ antiporter subunit E [Candidatus Cloacimonetes bacterium]|nr:Na+/H+ antiporter subunit E [Candidatus Cloacimonadota bacterium]MBS3767646.1 Na+/H+ antiporter subunit E [Candidatus Cloacimonadota bacterium]